MPARSHAEKNGQYSGASNRRLKREELTGRHVELLLNEQNVRLAAIHSEALTEIAISGILIPMTESTPQKDFRELVGFPRSPLPKLSRNHRASLKKLVEQSDRHLDPVIGLRMALCSGAAIKPDWLDAGVIDLALDSRDLGKHAEKLSSSRTVIRAESLVDVLSRRAESSPVIALRAIYKLSFPKRGLRKPGTGSELHADTAASVLKLASTLVPLLLRGNPKAKKKLSRELVQLVHVIATSTQAPEVVVRSLDFLRAFEKQVGWADLEAEPLATLREAILETPARLVPELLLRGCVVDATLLSDRLKPFNSAAQKFAEGVTNALNANRDRLPLVSRAWAQRLLQPDVGPPPTAESASDAAFERLALILVNSWEARSDGDNAAHAYGLVEEILRNGFGLHLVGDPGTVAPYDPDVHESKFPPEMGESIRVLRPWVELRSSDAVKILIKARVEVISGQ